MTDRVEAGQALGNALWLRRERELGLSRERLAERLGWSPGGGNGRDRSGWSPRTIVRIEKGQRGLRSDAEINTLATSLDLTPTALLGRIEAASTPPTGEADDLSAQIARISDPGQRALIERIASDLAGLAREIAGAPGEPDGGDR